MKVLHINKGQEGGAAWCARRINTALLKQGIESKMLFAEGTRMPEGIDGAIAEKDKTIWYSNWFTTKAKHLLNRIPFYIDADKMSAIFETINKHRPFSKHLHHPLSNYTNIAYHPLVKEADIIHLHWVPEFVDYPTFFKNVKKPIIWTLHDMFPAVGVMHYESDFSKLPEELKKLNDRCLNIKKTGIKKSNSLHIVAISDKMKEVINTSDVLGGLPTTLIHNGVDTKLYKPTEKASSKISEFINALDLNTKVFMFSSFAIEDKRKGLDRVFDALRMITAKTKKKIALVIVGGYKDADRLPEAPFPIFFTGRINDQKELAMIYTLCDYFINASYEEAFAQTPLEAMACGTPVIMTPCSGASDLIEPFNGVICDGFDSEALAKGIYKALNNHYDSELIRQYIIDEFDYDKIAKKYIRLYQNILMTCTSQ